MAASSKQNIQDSYTVTQVAARLGVAKNTLDKLRIYRPHDSPPFVRIGRRITYPADALETWMAARMEGGRCD